MQVDADGKRRRKPWKSREERAAARVNREAAERERHTEFQIAFSRLHELDADIALGGEDGAEALGQWLELATSLVDSFRSTKQLFPSDYKKKFTGMLTSFRRKGKKAADLEEEADQMANRLQRTMSASRPQYRRISHADSGPLQSRRRTMRLRKRASAGLTSTAGPISS